MEKVNSQIKKVKAKIRKAKKSSKDKAEKIEQLKARLNQLITKKELNLS